MTGNAPMTPAEAAAYVGRLFAALTTLAKQEFLGAPAVAKLGKARKKARRALSQTQGTKRD